jgi:hypothetical protein
LRVAEIRGFKWKGPGRPLHLLNSYATRDGSPVVVRVMVAIVIAVMVPVWVPFSTRVLIVTPIPIGIAHPTPLMAIDILFIVFRAFPTLVAILITGDTHTVIAIRIAALESASGGSRREKCRQHQAYSSGKKRGFGTA